MFITLLGDVGDPPTITGNIASAIGIDEKPLRTFRSATITVEASYFVAVNVKFEVNFKCRITLYILVQHFLIPSNLFVCVCHALVSFF